MKTLVFKSSRIWERDWGHGEWVWKPFTGSLFHHYGNPVEIESGILFGRLLQHIVTDKNADLISESLSGICGDSVLDQFKNVLETSAMHDMCGMQRIKIEPPIVEVEEHNDFPKSDVWSVYGVGNTKRLGPDSGFGLEHTPICDLKHYPVYFKPEMKIYDRRDGFSDQPTLQQSSTCNVWTLIHSLVREFTFFGVVRPDANL